MALHTWGHEYPDRNDPVYCSQCGDECDREAKWTNLGPWRPGDDPKDCGWQWVCKGCSNPCGGGCQLKEHKGYDTCDRSGRCELE